MTEDELKTLPPDPAEIVVEVEDKAPAKSAADEAAEKLKQQLEAAEKREKAARETADAERQARIAAEQRAQMREQQATQYYGDAQSAEWQRVNGAIDAVTKQIEMAEREEQRAMEAGEWANVSKARTMASEAVAQRVALLRDKNYYEQQYQATPQHEGRVEQQQQRQVDPVEALIAGATPATQAWLRANRQWIKKDPNGNHRLDGRVIAAHDEAEESGLKVDSPEYFEFIESRLKPQSQQKAPPMQDDKAAQSRPQQRQVAAPVSREVPGAKNTQRITLTAQQVEAAHMFGDPKKTTREREIEYWNNLKALEQEGRIGNTTH